MGTVADDLNWCQTILGDTSMIGNDGALWTRATLLEYYTEGYRQLLTHSQAVRRFTVLDVPGQFTAAITQDWEARYVQAGSYWRWTWPAPGGYACTSLWEVGFLEEMTTTTSAASEGVSQEWERLYVNPLHQYYRFALPQDHERIVGLWYDNRRLLGQQVRELDHLAGHWMSLGSYPLAWTQGVGRVRTLEMFEIVTAQQQGYAYAGTAPYGIPRYMTGERTYSTADIQTGFPRAIVSADRQYVPHRSALGVPRAYHSSDGNLLVLEVIGPDIPDLYEADTPRLLPRQLQKYLRFYTLAQAWTQQGPGYQPELAALCTQLFQQGVRVFRAMSWLTRKDAMLQRQPAHSQRAVRPPRPVLPSTYPRVW